MRTYEQARAVALHESVSPSRPSWWRHCQVFARQCVGAAPFGDSARLAWLGVPEQHRHTSFPPPAGSLAYYGSIESGAGHAVFAVDGGYVWSTDIERRGKVDKVPWDTDFWKHPYLGWIDACRWGALPVQQGETLALHAPRPPAYRRGRRVYASRMRQGQRDSDSVWNLQVALAAKGYRLHHGPSGDYDRATREACAAFQHRRGWRGKGADGIAGPLTVHALGLVWVAG
ncbi:putative peptidoglycan binding protein [Motilibacter rhizosphaerae]|uniref:Putative peptidoglycan binding protein n=1 Tax=Motilibacter rhizosphaerae TaxID=598652 RepID=A0A4Q7NPF7_9ACTN|nr:peptidoglycan-binding protein [Motilibacter rhizosphaerae]RZS87063.1 putative peptidoglycan binding protein [Motilibacter rhizosphaerae]